ncbi:MAG: carbohydrate binding domain-containing protein [Dictyoglomus sp.]
MYKRFLVFLILLSILGVAAGCAPTETKTAVLPEVKVETKVAEVPEIAGAVIITTFETGESEKWVARGEGVSILVTDKEAHTGKYSLYIKGRSSGWHGTQIQLKDLLKPGKVYSISLWVMHKNELPQHIGLTMQRKYNTDSSTQYDWIKHEMEIPGGKWVELSGSYEIPAGVSIEDLTLYVEAPKNVNLEFYIDDLVIVEGKKGFKITPELFDLFAKYYGECFN